VLDLVKRNEMSQLTKICDQLEEEIAKATPMDCPTLLGDLERLKGLVWAKMLLERPNGHACEDDLLDMDQVAKALSIPEGRAYELARRGTLQAVKIGKYVRVTPEALRKYLRQLEVNKL
jgi:excisionase family DNA binding protein